jgi:hypothetical protein
MDTSRREDSYGEAPEQLMEPMAVVVEPAVTVKPDFGHADAPGSRQRRR